MCKIDGGTLEMVDGTDKMTVKLSPYYIDQFEVTNAQIAHYLNATRALKCRDASVAAPCFQAETDEALARNHSRFIVQKPDGSFTTVSGFETVPYDGATRQGAAEYCAWVGKSLPTEPQWEFAARHDPKSGKDFLYPWGDTFDGKRARCAREHCPEAPGLGPDEINQSRPAPVGSYAAGQSPWGLFDVAGNTDEHVADCLYAYRACNGGACVDPAPHGPERGKCETVTRGGHTQGPRQLATSNRQQSDPDKRAGIRCAAAVK
jgi:formylglycine-generating enzyme required for sulfatase activity